LGWGESIIKYIEHDSAADGSDMADFVEQFSRPIPGGT
jgi:hypothetical protein